MDKSYTPRDRLHENYRNLSEFRKMVDAFAAARKECNCEYLISDAFKLSYDVARGKKIP